MICYIFPSKIEYLLLQQMVMVFLLSILFKLIHDVPICFSVAEQNGNVRLQSVSSYQRRQATMPHSSVCTAVLPTAVGPTKVPAALHNLALQICTTDKQQQPPLQSALCKNLQRIDYTLEYLQQPMPLIVSHLLGQQQLVSPQYLVTIIT